MFTLLAREVPALHLHEVRRFEAQWEREASVRLRDGDMAAVAAYDRHGRIRGADEEAAYDRAASMWLADHLRGKDVLLLAGSNTEAAELSRRVQAMLAAMGAVGPPQAVLSAHTLQDAQLAGHDIGELIDRITVGPDGRRPVDRQRPAWPPSAPAAPGAEVQRDVGAADASECSGAGSRAGCGA